MNSGNVGCSSGSPFTPPLNSGNIGCPSGSPFTPPLNSGNVGWTSGSPFSVCLLTVIVTSTSSVLLSGYVIVIFAETLPGVSVLGTIPFFHSTLVPSGNSFTFSILSFAFGISPFVIVCGFGCGL